MKFLHKKYITEIESLQQELALKTAQISQIEQELTERINQLESQENKLNRIPELNKEITYLRKELDLKIGHIVFIESKLTHEIYQYSLYNKKYNEKDIYGRIDGFKQVPLISIICSIHVLDIDRLIKKIDSVKAQFYLNWEMQLIIPEVLYSNYSQLSDLASSQIKFLVIDETDTIQSSLQKALKQVSGDYLLKTHEYDLLSRDALYEMCLSINNNPQLKIDCIYADEDKIDKNGIFYDFHFKPDYAPDYLYSSNYIGHNFLIKTSLLAQDDCFLRKTEQCNDYELLLNLSDKNSQIIHIPKILFHQYPDEENTLDNIDTIKNKHQADKQALEKMINRRGIQASIKDGRYPQTYRLQREIIGKPLVSIVIPFKDRPDLLKQCIISILEKSTWQEFEIIGISNNSEQADTVELMTYLSNKDNRIQFHEYNIPFNYSKINNYAVDNFVNGQHIVFLNNDTEIISPSWIEALLEFSQQADVGAVGAKLLFPDRTIQHAGMIIGNGPFVGHGHRFLPDFSSGYFMRPHLVQNVSAVTAACMMIKKEVFTELCGFEEEHLCVTYNDVDFCLRLMKSGYKNIYTPYCEMFHYETATRGHDISAEQLTRVQNELNYMMSHHQDVYSLGDPFYNPNLTREKEDFSVNAQITL